MDLEKYNPNHNQAVTPVTLTQHDHSGKGGDNAKFTESWDYVQENHKCCGQYGWADYTTPNASNWHSTNFGVSGFDCWTRTRSSLFKFA